MIILNSEHLVFYVTEQSKNWIT